MKILKSKTWQFAAAGQEHEIVLFGKYIFDYRWNNTHKSVTVKDPLYNQDHRFGIYEVEIDGEIHKFAAGEFSNGIWGFYIYKY